MADETLEPFKGLQLLKLLKQPYKLNTRACLKLFQVDLNRLPLGTQTYGCYKLSLHGCFKSLILWGFIQLLNCYGSFKPFTAALTASAEESDNSLSCQK